MKYLVYKEPFYPAKDLYPNEIKISRFVCTIPDQDLSDIASLKKIAQVSKSDKYSIKELTNSQFLVLNANRVLQGYQPLTEMRLAEVAKKCEITEKEKEKL